ncbi:MAG: YceI family protein [Novosphingobium sp.]
MIRIPRALALALPLACAVLAVPMVAQAPAGVPGQPDLSRLTAGTYTADPTHSLVSWRINHLGFNDNFGLAGDVSGSLTLDPANLSASKVSATIPLAKLVTANPDITAELLKAGPDGGKPHFFGANPADATFVSTGVVPGTDGTSAVINGNLTLNGITHPVALKARFTGAGTNMFRSSKRTIGFMAETTILRSDYGITFLLPIVGDEVALTISAAFENS